MSEITLEVERREETGKNANRRLRSGGTVPAVVYGGGRDPVPIRVDHKLLQTHLRAESGGNAVFLLQLAGSGQERHAMIREIQHNPLNGDLIHVDFQRISMTDQIRVKVPVEIVGTAYAVKNEGAMLDFITREIEVECLPTAIPSKLEADVSELNVGQHLEAHELVLPEGVTLIDEPERVVLSITHRRVAEVEEEAAAEPEVLIEADKEEPEVIRRGKVEEENE